MSEPLHAQADLSTEGAPPIDMEAFRQEMHEQGLEDLVDELIAAFLNDAPTRFEALRAAVESAEAGSIRSAAHAYKSAAATMRAERLAGVLQQTEAAAREGDVTRPAELFPRVRTEHEALLAYIQ